MIELSPEQQRFVDAQIATGFYKAPDEVVAEALQLLSKQKSTERDEVRAAIRTSVPDMEAGRGTPLQEVDAEIREKFGFARRKP